MKILCPHCSQTLEVPAELAGQTVPCPTCRGMLSLPVPAVVAVASPTRPGLPTPWVIGLTAVIVGLVATVIGLLVARPRGVPTVSMPAKAPSAPANPTPPPDPVVSRDLTGWVVPTVPAADPQGWVTLFDGQRLYGASQTNANLVSGRVALKDGLLAVDSTAGFNGGIPFNWQGRDVALRVRAKLVSGQNFLLGIGRYAAFHNGGTLFGFGQGDNGWQDLMGTNLPPAGSEFVDMEFRVVAGTITLLANGTTAATMKAPVLQDSYRVSIATVNGLSLFKKVEVKEFR